MRADARQSRGSGAGFRLIMRYLRLLFLVPSSVCMSSDSKELQQYAVPVDRVRSSIRSLDLMEETVWWEERSGNRSRDGGRTPHGL